MFENRELMRMFEATRSEIKKYALTEELHNLFSSAHIVAVTKSRG